MKKTQKLVLLIGCMLLSIALRGQGNWSYTAPQLGKGLHYTDLYVGVQVNSPLFWGDLRSLGEETHLGIGASLFGGYSFNDWLSTELVLEYGEGKLGARNDQMNDYLSKEGLIVYGQHSPTDRKLGDLYSQISYKEVGVRIQLGVLSLLAPKPFRRFDIEVAPAIYWQKFHTKLCRKEGDNTLEDYGLGDSDWDYAVGGDLGFRYNFMNSGTSLFFRTGVLWLNNEDFDGVNNNPLWRANLQVNASAGVRFYLFRM